MPVPDDPVSRAARGVYGISVASELSGFDPQTLRLYERRGLLTPARTDGGTSRKRPRRHSVPLAPGRSGRMRTPPRRRWSSLRTLLCEPPGKRIVMAVDG